MPRTNFPHPSTRSIVSTGENWNDALKTAASRARWFAPIYVITWFLLANYLLIQLFVAAILQQLDESETARAEEQERRFAAAWKHEAQKRRARAARRARERDSQATAARQTSELGGSFDARLAAVMAKEDAEGVLRSDDADTASPTGAAAALHDRAAHHRMQSSGGDPSTPGEGLAAEMGGAMPPWRGGAGGGGGGGGVVPTDDMEEEVSDEEPLPTCRVEYDHETDTLRRVPIIWYNRRGSVVMSPPTSPPPALPAPARLRTESSRRAGRVSEPPRPLRVGGSSRFAPVARSLSLSPPATAPTAATDSGAPALHAAVNPLADSGTTAPAPADAPVSSVPLVLAIPASAGVPNMGPRFAMSTAAMPPGPAPLRAGASSGGGGVASLTAPAGRTRSRDAGAQSRGAAIPIPAPEAAVVVVGEHEHEQPSQRAAPAPEEGVTQPRAGSKGHALFGAGVLARPRLTADPERDVEYIMSSSVALKAAHDRLAGSHGTPAPPAVGAGEVRSASAMAALQTAHTASVGAGSAVGTPVGPIRASSDGVRLTSPLASASASRQGHSHASRSAHAAALAARAPGGLEADAEIMRGMLTSRGAAASSSQAGTRPGSAQAGFRAASGGSALGHVAGRTVHSLMAGAAAASSTPSQRVVAAMDAARSVKLADASAAIEDARKRRDANSAGGAPASASAAADAADAAADVLAGGFAAYLPPTLAAAVLHEDVDGVERSVHEGSGSPPISSAVAAAPPGVGMMMASGSMSLDVGGGSMDILALEDMDDITVPPPIPWWCRRCVRPADVEQPGWTHNIMAALAGQGFSLPVGNDKAFGCVPPRNPVRTAARYVIDSWWFDWFMAAVILASVVSLGMEDYDALIRGVIWFRIADAVFTACFLAEMVLKLVADGVLTTPHAYLRSGWNVFDGIIAILSLVDVLAGVRYTAANDISTSARIIRLGRTMRPLKLLERFEATRTLMFALWSGRWEILNAFLILGLVLFAFAVAGRDLFADRMGSCTDVTIVHRADCVGVFADATGTLSVRLWQVPMANFDTISNALSALFETGTLVGWIDTMWRVMDIRLGDPGTGPLYHASAANSWYFVAFIFVCAYIVLRVSE